MTHNVLFLSIVTKSHKGKRLIPLHVLCDPRGDYFSIHGFKKIEIHPCFAITTDKAQGKSFSRALGIDLNHECFTYGHLYVALSFITHPSKLSVTLKRYALSTSNVLYGSILPAQV